MLIMNTRWLALIACSALLTGCAGMQNPQKANLAHCANQLKASKAENYPLVLQEGDLCLQKATLPASLHSLIYAVQADAYLNLKRFPEALAAKEKSMQLVVKPEPRAYLDLSAMYRAAGNPKKALELVQFNLDNGMGEAGKGAGFNMPTYYHLGLALTDLGQYREAAEAFSTGLQRQPDYAWAYYARGIAYDHLGNREDAKADFMKFSQIVDKKYLEQENKAKLAEYRISMP
ncbi:tetratricopeptide repeat protein [Pseudomonas marginalis]|jgi:tetratricopeptide (TPR) repeat protein|uniref:Tetratricopeptide repeat protein n=2 Tax=Pseudomonas TaxID=286 RepID=A0A9X9BQP4_PSEMA|nr:tetratricopeptide repeat protein [Pseudomonas sp. JV449]TKJ75711.1 tetratricopeptide repeat protein [Pseudomonas sp. CFBP13509]TWR58135.1 tetratricopeptide repeat protein [Pseudomonas marginalis]